MKVGISTSSFGQADPAPLQRLRTAGVDVVPNPHGRRLTRDEAVEFVSELDGLIAGLEPLDADVLGSAKRLKAVARVGIGTDNVDKDAASELGIAVSNTPDPPTAAVAELTLTAMLALLRDFGPTTDGMRDRRWSKSIQGSLSGAEVLLVGLGRIGRRVATLVLGFGGRVAAVDPFLGASDVADGIRLTSLDEGLPSADVVSIHASGADPILTEREFGFMRDGVILLNAARGSLVDEDALAVALDSGRVGRAWFDAFWEEPYEGELLDRDNFYATPHVATYTASCRRAMESQAVANLLRDLGLGEDS